MNRRPPIPTLFPSTPLSPSQLPAVLGGRSEVHARSRTPRDRPRQPGAPRAPAAAADRGRVRVHHPHRQDRKSTRLNSSHQIISYAVFCLKKKKQKEQSEHTD